MPILPTFLESFVVSGGGGPALVQSVSNVNGVSPDVTQTKFILAFAAPVANGHIYTVKFGYATHGETIVSALDDQGNAGVKLDERNNLFAQSVWQFTATIGTPQTVTFTLSDTFGSSQFMAQDEFSGVTQVDAVNHAGDNDTHTNSVSSAITTAATGVVEGFVMVLANASPTSLDSPLTQVAAEVWRGGDFFGATCVYVPSAAGTYDANWHFAGANAYTEIMTSLK